MGGPRRGAHARRRPRVARARRRVTRSSPRCVEPGPRARRPAAVLPDVRGRLLRAARLPSDRRGAGRARGVRRAAALDGRGRRRVPRPRPGQAEHPRQHPDAARAALDASVWREVAEAHGGGTVVGAAARQCEQRSEEDRQRAHEDQRDRERPGGDEEQAGRQLGRR